MSHDKDGIEIHVKYKRAINEKDLAYYQPSNTNWNTI